MSVRPHPDRPGYWIIDCRPEGYKGKRERVTIPGTEEQALAQERWLMRRNTEIITPTARTLTGIYPAWIASYKIDHAKRTVEDAQDCWNHLKVTFGKLQPKALNRALIDTYKKSRLDDGVKPRTINKELSYFSVLIKWAAENSFCEPLPFIIQKFPKKMAAAPKPRPLRPEQITAILEVIEPEYRLVFLLMADCGLRRNEALSLTREQVEFDSGIIFVTGKGSKERIVPITSDRLMLELLTKKDTKGWLLVNSTTKKPYTTIRKALLRAAAKAGIDKHLYHHLLRHSFGTAATVAGYDLSALQSIMGHSSSTTTGIYQHLAGEYLRGQGRKLNDKIMQEGKKEDD